MGDGRADRRRRAQPGRAPQRDALDDPGRRSRRAGAERAGRTARPRSGRDRGRPVRLRDPDRRASLERRPQRRARGRLAGDGDRHHGRPAVRLLDADELQRGRGRLVGPARPRRLRRRRDDVARPDGLEQRLHVGEGARALGDRSPGDLGGGDRRALGSLPRGARPLLAPVARACSPGDRRGPVRARDRADRPHQPARGRRLRHRRGCPPRLVARTVGAAPAGVRRGREDHRRQLEPDRRRRRSGADRLRAEGDRPRSLARERASSASASPASTRT